MSRPSKQGLNAFTLNVRFLDSEMMRNIIKSHGSDGVVVALALMGMIYEKGYYIKWGDYTKFILWQTLPALTPDKLGRIVESLVQYGFFDATFFAQGILTSQEIQRQYAYATKRRVKANEDLQYALKSEAKAVVSVDNNPNFCIQKLPFLHTETPVSVDRNPSYCIQKPELLYTETPVSVDRNSQNDGKIAQNYEFLYAETPISVDRNSDSIQKQKEQEKETEKESSPHTPYKEKEKEKEKEKFPPHDDAARAYAYMREGSEPKDFERFLNEFFAPNRTGFIEQASMSLGISSERLRKLAEETINDWSLTQQQHIDFNDRARHLMAVIRKKLSYATSYNTPTKSTSRESLKSTPPTTDPTADWESGF